MMKEELTVKLMRLRSDRDYKSINSDRSVLVWTVLTLTFLDLCKSCVR